MSGRPEATGGGYQDREPEPYDRHAWEEFTPWRPGDASTSGEAPRSYGATGYDEDRVYRPSTDDSAGQHGQAAQSRPGSAPDAAEPRRRFQWSEDSRKYNGGERVKASEAIGGDFTKRVQKGAVGRVVSREQTWSGERLTVDFGSYVEKDVKPDAIERDSWF